MFVIKNLLLFFMKMKMLLMFVTNVLYQKINGKTSIIYRI